jgi:hypothetical protein
MVIDTGWMLALVIVGALGVPAAVLAWVLRWCALPGGWAAASIVAGIVVGLLAGPGVMGRVRPDLHTRLFVGAATQRDAADTLERRQNADIKGLLQAGVTPAAIDELRVQHAAELEPLRTAQRDAEREHRRWLWTAASIMVAAYAMCIIPSVLRYRSVGGVPTPDPGLVRGTRGAMVGMLGAIVTGAIPFIAAAWLMRAGLAASLGWALMFAISGLASTIRFEARAACLQIVVVSLCFGYMIAPSSAGPMLWGAVAAGFAIVLLTSAVARTPSRARSVRTIRRVTRRAAVCVVLPGIAAIVAVTVDLHALAAAPGAAFWVAIVVAVLYASDGRWGGYWLAWRAAGRADEHHEAWPRSTAMLNSGAGVAQLVMLVLLLAGGTATPQMAAGGLLGAAIVEVTRGARVWLLPTLARGRGSSDVAEG